jgi:hypothetical protein
MEANKMAWSEVPSFFIINWTHSSQCLSDKSPFHLADFPLLDSQSNSFTDLFNNALLRVVVMQLQMLNDIPQTK